MKLLMTLAGYVQPPNPFGGCKFSGIGREHGKFGFHEVSNIKVIAREKYYADRIEK